MALRRSDGSWGEAWASFKYNLPLGFSWMRRFPILSSAWRRGASWARRTRGSYNIRTRIHEHAVVAKAGYIYPFNVRELPLFNAPLVELVYQTFLSKGRPLVVVDIGAGIGDTALLVLENCPGMISQVVCIEGDREFFDLLQQNVAFASNVTAILQMLSRDAQSSRSLVHIHQSTASAVGTDFVSALTLDDTLTQNRVPAVDVLKIDIDGSDGVALAGAPAILKTAQPTVIFEWHPKLCRAAGNSWMEHFDQLAAAGYDRFVWFYKTGEFNHFMNVVDQAGVRQLAEFCFADKTDDDRHYDVVALSPTHRIDPAAIALLDFARKRISPF